MAEKGFDWHRVLVGTAPWAFLAEVLLRVVLVYLVLVLVVRLLGKRLSGRIGNLELAVMMALGAIVSVPFQDPMRGVVPGMVLMVALLAIQRGLGALGVRFRAVESATQNHATVLVKDGVLVLDELRAASISTRQLFAVLRAQGLRHLGEARRVYLEAYGCFSVFRQRPPTAGLSLSPSWDEALDASAPRATDTLACSHCGSLTRAAQDGASAPPCAHCGERAWVAALSGD